MIGIVYNPATNKGASVERMKKIRTMLDEKGVEYEYRESTYAGESIALAKELAQTCDVIVSAGGDGTLFEVLNGTIDTDVTYCLLPFGSGNDTSMTLGLHGKSDEELVETILNGKERLVDCEIFNDETISMQFAAFGIVPEVLANFLKKKKSRGINYVMALLGALIRHKAKNYKVEVDGVEEEYFSDMIAIMNIKTAGGGLKICPEAEVDDRKLDLIVVKHTGFFRYMGNVIALARGKLMSQPNAIHRKVDCATLICQSEENCVIDGEMYTLERVKMAIYPKQIKFRV